LSFLSAKSIRHLSLGLPEVDEVYHGFEYGDFGVLYGDWIYFLSSLLSVRGVMPPAMGGLGSPVVFVDGGNSFNPYFIGEIARGYGLDPREVLSSIHVSRAFTAYQLSALVLERLEPFISTKGAGLVLVSDVASLFLDRDIPKTEAKELFLKVCAKLSDIAEKRKWIVLATYRQPYRSKLGMFVEAALFGRSNVLIRLERRGNIMIFDLQVHHRMNPIKIRIDLPTKDAKLTSYLKS